MFVFKNPPGRQFWRAIGAGIGVVGVISGSLIGVLSTPAAGETMSPQDRTACERGASCLWDKENYTGNLHTVDLRTGNPGECIPLPSGFTGRSLANRSDRDLSVYADANCGKDTKYEVYPGGGTFAPTAPFIIAAITIGE